SEILSDARWVAPPAITILLEANVPMPYGETSLSPCRTDTLAGLTPSASPQTCARVVSNPCPCDWTPVRTTTLPEGSTVTVADSNPKPTGSPLLAHSIWPCAVCSVYEA